jgi:hypothetical protein
MRKKLKNEKNNFIRKDLRIIRKEKGNKKALLGGLNL